VGGCDKDTPRTGATAALRRSPLRSTFCSVLFRWPSSFQVYVRLCWVYGWFTLKGGLGGWVDSRGSVAFPVDQFDSIFRYSRAPFFLVESQHVHMLKRVSFTFFFYSRVNNCMGRIVKYVR